MRHSGTTVRSRSPFVAAALFALLAAMAPGAASAETSLSVNVERTTIYRDQPLSVDIVISGDYDEMEGPALDGFEIVGRSEGRSFSIGFGRPRSERTISLTLAPSRTGRLEIGAARLMLDGKAVASSKAVAITVRDEDMPASEQRQGNRQGRFSLFPQFQPPQLAQPRVETVKTPLIEARLSCGDRPVYPGETFNLKFVLLTPTSPERWSATVTAKPDMEGLVVREAPRSREAPAEVRRPDGTWYETILFNAAVTPIKDGEISIPAYTMDLVHLNFQEFSVGSEPVVIKVLPMPSEGMPEGFEPGAVGSFSMTAQLEDAVVAPGDSTTLSVAVTGMGNIVAVREPVITVDEAVKIDSFANAQGSDDIAVGDEGLSGTRTFKFLLTPGRETPGGEFKVRVEPLVYFDPLTGRWGKAEAGDMTLTVRGSPRAEKPQARPTGVMGIIETSQLADPPPPKKTWFDTTMFFFMMALPVFILVAVETVHAARRRLNRQGGRASARKALRRAMAELSRLERSTADDTGFWTALELLLRQYVEARFDIATAAMTPSDIATAVSGAGAGEEVAAELLDLLEQCSLARFAGRIGAGDRAGICGRAGQCLTSLDRSGGGAA